MNKELFNSAAKWALLLGATMSASRIFETWVLISGDFKLFAGLTFEWLLAVGVYIFIIYAASKRRGAMVVAAEPERGYKVRDVMNYAVIISAMAAVIVGVSSHIYVVNVIGGYSEYTQLSADSIMKVVSEVEVSSELNELYTSSTESIREAGANAPTIFSTTISMVANYIISGFIIGGVVGLFTRRRAVAPQMCDEDQD